MEATNRHEAHSGGRRQESGSEEKNTPLEPPYFGWTSEKARLLADETGVTDPVRAVCKKVHELLDRLNLTGPPFSPFEAASGAGIVRIKYRHLVDADALLIPTNDGFEVTLDVRDSPVRRRFSLAHEIGHTFFFGLGRSREELRDRISELFTSRDEEERLCDIAAAELLMPAAVVIRMLDSEPPSLRTLIKIADQFQVSLGVAGRRVIDLGIWTCALIRWKESSELNRLAIDWARSSMGYIPFEAKAKPQWLIAEAISNKATRAEVLGMKFGGVKGDVVIESTPRRYGADHRLQVISLMYKLRGEAPRVSGTGWTPPSTNPH